MEVEVNLPELKESGVVCYPRLFWTHFSLRRQLLAQQAKAIHYVCHMPDVWK
jgi:hypothetical protein